MVVVETCVVWTPLVWEVSKDTRLWSMARDKSIIKLGSWSARFLCSVLLQTTMLLAFAIVLAYMRADCLATLATVVLAVSSIAMCYFALDAVKTENAFQLAAYLATATSLHVAIFLTLVATTPDQEAWWKKPPLSYVVWAALPILAALQLLSYIFAFATWSGTADTNGFGMRMYKKVGTDPELIYLYLRYQRHCSILKLDLLFQLGILAFMLIGDKVLSTSWWISLFCQLPIAIIWIPLGLASIRREWRLGMAVIGLMAIAQPAIYIFQLILEGSRIIFDSDAPRTCASEMHNLFHDYVVAFYTMFAVALLCRLLFLGSAIMARLSFGRGLRERVHSDFRRPTSITSAFRSTFEHAAQSEP